MKLEDSATYRVVAGGLVVEVCVDGKFELFWLLKLVVFQGMGDVQIWMWKKEVEGGEEVEGGK